MKQPSQASGTDEQAPIVDRWVDGGVEEGQTSRAGALLRQAIRPQPLEAGAFAAIRARLRRQARRPERHWALRLAIAIVLVLSGSALTAGAQLYFHILGPRRPAPAVKAPAPAPEPRARSRGHATHVALEAETAAPEGDPPTPPAEAAAPVVAAPVPPAEAIAPPHPRSPASRAVPPSPPIVAPADVTPPPAPPTESASVLARESALLAGALRKLRQDDDARAALRMLDEHDTEFAAGPLAPEATLARIEALIRLHRNRDALALLDRTDPSPVGGERDLLIARAELRAAAGRSAAATRDFDALLTGDLAFDAAAERALWGRASCRAAAGDARGARRDLQDYLARFPNGRFAGNARATLGQ
ncbi:MAG TPA: hypothetical protein VKQ32_06875 [Polyangia bacterium]|nr:hypothetical protein [Polyangia bacterium]